MEITYVNQKEITDLTDERPILFTRASVVLLPMSPWALARTWYLGNNSGLSCDILGGKKNCVKFWVKI